MPNGGDDNIDDLIRELRRTNQRLDELVSAIQRGAQESGGEDEPVIDLWNVGDSNRTVTSVDEYIQERARAANSPNVTAPGIKNIAPGAMAKFFHDVYTRGGDNLQRIMWALGNDKFDQFIRILSSDYGIEKSLVESVEPSSIDFGISVNERNVTVDYPNTPFNFIVIDGFNYYFPSQIEMDAQVAPQTVITTLGLRRLDQSLENFRRVDFGGMRAQEVQITDEGNFIVFGGKPPSLVNQELRDRL